MNQQIQDNIAVSIEELKTAQEQQRLKKFENAKRKQDLAQQKELKSEEKQKQVQPQSITTKVIKINPAEEKILKRQEKAKQEQLAKENKQRKQSNSAEKIVYDLEQKLLRIDFKIIKRNQSIEKITKENVRKEKTYNKAKTILDSDTIYWQRRIAKQNKKESNLANYVASLERRMAKLQERLDRYTSKYNKETSKKKLNIDQKIDRRTKYISTLKKGIDSRNIYIESLNDKQKKDVYAKETIQKQLEQYQYDNSN